MSLALSEQAVHEWISRAQIGEVRISGRIIHNRTSFMQMDKRTWMIEDKSACCELKDD
jgi:hypothetical protein